MSATPPQGALRDWIDMRADAGGPAFTFPEGGASLDWPTLRNRAHDIAQLLTAQGAARGESVAIMQPNGRAALECLFGTLYGGFRATMINLVAGPEAIGYALGHSGARFAFVGDDHLALFNQADTGGMSLLDPSADNTPDIALHPVAPSDHALLMYTSGTTGQPKGVVHTQSSLLAGGWTTTIAHTLTPDDCGLCVLPIYHINGLCVSVMGTLVSGGTLAMCPRFSSNRFWDHARDAQATWFSVVPTIISHLLHGPANPDATTRARLRFGRSASSPLSPEVQRAFETRFEVPIIETMGLTETAAQILSNPLPPAPRKIGSPGIAFGNEATILSPDLNPIPHGQEGEIAVRGPNIMLEYLNNPKATADSFTPDGWLRTGDLGRQDADGYFFVTGRLKELIIKGGENIAPREIDEALYAHPDVVEAAAFSCPCDSYGERVEAAVTVKPGSAVTADQLLALCTRRLGKFKCPDRVHFLDELPKGPSGKIQRRILSETLNAALPAKA
ncbi:putative sulfoacetate--CoA ligase [Roseovarius litorisediminis]|uniref:Putative sulfoacetate--CoA ligase n=1 Tax=Roseovarius litorisediminis TaxID=1312363 RepID=A0A1Y5SE35_9RHOB|nr:AMP-binding protein [Roseovarius litorisediminis]SLN38594.1 putative sulfoacetate--CoA ligase [Roseovarius litorisediminis]